MAEHAPPSVDDVPLVVALTQDLFFGVRIEDAIRARHPAIKRIFIEARHPTAGS